MATADLISSFLSNEMSPDRERQFLLSVAASDSLRLELKSHMVLDRVLLGRAQRARVPDAIRQAILTEAGASDGAPTAVAISSRPNAPASVAARRGFLSRWGGRTAAILAAFACFGAGYYAGELGVPAATQASSAARTSSPRTTAPAVPVDARAASGTELKAAPSTSVTESRASRVAPLQRPAEHRNVATAARSGNTPTATTPATTAQPSNGDRSLMDRPGRDPQSVGFDQTIEKPSDQDRQNQTEPK